MNMRFLQILSFILGTFSLSAQHTSPLGLPLKIENLQIDGPLIEPIPRKNREASLVVRVLSSSPNDKGHKYTLEVYGLDPGNHKISEYLRRTSGEPIPVLLEDTLNVSVINSLDAIPEPTNLQHTPPEKIGGYRLLMTSLGTVWIAVLFVFIFYKKKQQAPKPEPTPPTLHDKLTKLVKSAAQGELSDENRATLERLIIGHWQKELPEINELPAPQALTKLREHPNASPLLLKLEQWLHAPKKSISQEEIAPLLQPFKRTKPTLKSIS